jgi:hypothetical protein
MEQKGFAVEWAEVIRGLNNLQQVELFLQGSRFLLRSQLKGDALKPSALPKSPSHRPSGNPLRVSLPAGAQM